MKTTSYVRAATSVLALAALVAPGQALAGKVKLPPGDNSNFWERWKPAKEERIVALAGKPSATADAANNTVNVYIPIVCGTSWHGMYIDPSPCTDADVATLRLGAPYENIVPTIVVGDGQASVPDNRIARYTLPVSAIATGLQSARLPSFTNEITNDAEEVQTFVRQPPAWIDGTTVRMVNGWWSAEGAVPQGANPALPVVIGAQARLGRVTPAVLETLASVGSRTTFVADHQGRARVACGPLDPALVPSSTSRSVIASFVVPQKRTPGTSCDDDLLWQLIRVMKYSGFGSSVASVYYDDSAYGDKFVCNWKGYSEPTTSFVGKWNDGHGREACLVTNIPDRSGRIKSKNVSALLNVDLINSGTYFAALNMPLWPFRDDRTQANYSDGKVRAGQSVFDKFSKQWASELDQVRAIQAAFYSAPDGVLSDPSAYTPYDPNFASAYATATGATEAKYWPVGFAMPMLPERWQSIATRIDTKPDVLNLTRAFQEATR